jgi:hypothetical protein
MLETRRNRMGKSTLLSDSRSDEGERCGDENI